ncbi:MAG: hypothetical protein Q9163_006466, partial [Psora crenata]
TRRTEGLANPTTPDLVDAGTVFVPLTAAVALSQVFSQPAPKPLYPGPWSIPEFEKGFPDIIAAYQRNCLQQQQQKEERQQQDRRQQQQRWQQHWSDQTSFASKSDSHPCHESRDNRQAPDDPPMSHGPSETRPSSNSWRERRLPGPPPPIPSRQLPPLQSNEPAAALQDVLQGAPLGHGVPMRPTPPPSSTPPEQRLSRPIGVENLLNPTAGDGTGVASRPHNRENTESPRSAPMAAKSRPATPSLTPSSMRKLSAGETTLPFITPPLRNTYPHPIRRSLTPRSPTSYVPAPITTGLPTATIDVRQSPFVLSGDQTSVPGGSGPVILPEPAMTSSTLPAPYVASAPPPRSSPRLRQIGQSGPTPSSHARGQHLLDRPGNVGPVAHPLSRSTSPTIHHPRNSPPAGPPLVASTGQPQSFFSAPFPSTRAGSTMPQPAFDKKAFDSPSPGGSVPSQYQMMTLETEQGPIQVPVDVQAASKVADEKRKRNATASHRFRQRRKEKEQETSNNIAKLEAQVREITEEKEHYQRERDFFQDVVLRNRIPIPPRPVSPWRKRQAASQGGGSRYQDAEPAAAAARNEGRNTRRRTSTYVPPQGPAPHTVEPPPAMPPLERMNAAMTSEHVPGLQPRMRPPGPFHANADAFHSGTSR